ncbi:MAG: ester cyclase [Herpetosiphonaceae bacterium]|nr:ester cyclase [Herpetosiphonaceae bacterium]
MTDQQYETVNFDNRDIAAYGNGERRMPMRGFEPQYTDIVDYIVRITHKIWEEKAVGYIYDTYQHNCVVHGSGGDTHGREVVVANTLQSLAAYPDDRAYAHDVIWMGNEDDGFHTSHLIIGVAHNTGYSRYGPPTGRKIVWHTIANCVARENRIFEEWLLRDEPYVIRQMGYDVDLIVEQQARALLAQGAPADPVGEIGRTLGQFPPLRVTPRTDSPFDVEDFVRATYHDIWNQRMFNVIAARYAANHVCTTISGRTLHGQAELTTFLLGIFGMFPDAGVVVDHLYWNSDDAQGYRVAVRWTLTGTHTGYGVYGAPSGARVRIMGLSHHHVKNGTFTKEYTVFDEMELLRRIALQRLITQQ